MEKLKAKLRLSLGTKVLVPVVVSMVLLLVVTVLVVNGRITRQFQMEAARNLALADMALLRSRNIRTHDLLERYHNLPKEPRYRAAFQSGDRPRNWKQRGPGFAGFYPMPGRIAGQWTRDRLVSGAAGPERTVDRPVPTSAWRGTDCRSAKSRAGGRTLFLLGGRIHFPKP